MPMMPNTLAMPTRDSPLALRKRATASACQVTLAWALNQTLSTFGPIDGLHLSRALRNVTFTEAVIEKFYVNENGDRLADFTLKDFNSDSTEMNVSRVWKAFEAQRLRRPGSRHT